MQLLDACPLCRTTLHGNPERCPSCGGDLRPFQDAAQRVDALNRLARQLLAEGDAARAAPLIAQLPQLGTVNPDDLRELNARLALLSGDPGRARELAAGLAGEAQAALLHECSALEYRRRRARELYNAALLKARSGLHASAAGELQQAVALDSDDAVLWQLKLKVDLKARLYGNCYEDLAALDRLRARPLEMARLEALLPSTAHAH